MFSHTFKTYTVAIKNTTLHTLGFKRFLLTLGLMAVCTGRRAILPAHGSRAIAKPPTHHINKPATTTSKSRVVFRHLEKVEGANKKKPTLDLSKTRQSDKIRVQKELKKQPVNRRVPAILPKHAVAIGQARHTSKVQDKNRSMRRAPPRQPAHAAHPAHAGQPARGQHA